MGKADGLLDALPDMEGKMWRGICYKGEVGNKVITRVHNTMSVYQIHGNYVREYICVYMCGCEGLYPYEHFYMLILVCP